MRRLAIVALLTLACTPPPDDTPVAPTPTADPSHPKITSSLQLMAERFGDDKGSGAAPAGGANRASLVPGSPAEGTLDSSDPTRAQTDIAYDAWTFTARAGELVRVSVESSDFDTVVWILSPNGDALSFNDDGNATTNSTAHALLSAAGEYGVIVSAYDTAHGNYRVSLATTVATALDRDAATGALATDDPAFDNGTHYEVWRYAATAGETVGIQLTSSDFDTTLLVMDTAGEILASNDDRGDGSTDSALSFTFPATATYAIVANSYAAGATGTYALSLSAAAPIELTADGDPDGSYALVVGIGDYPGTGNDLPLGPIQDADAIAELLVSDFGFARDNVLVLRDSQATRENILAAFLVHLGQAGPDGRALFYYSGHGTQTESNEALTGALDPEDDDKDEALVAYDALILDDEIGYLADRLNTDNALLVYDSCFSGTGSRGDARLMKYGEYDDFEPYLAKSNRSTLTLSEATAALPGMLRTPDRHVLLASSSDTELSWVSGELGISAFTYFLIEHLRGAAPTMTVAELGDAVRSDTMAQVMNEHQERQTPQVEGAAADDPLSRFLPR